MLAALGALGAVSTIFNALTSAGSSASSQKTTGLTQGAASFSAATTTSSTAASAPVSGGGSSLGKLSPDTLNDLFALLDADGNGAVSKSEFETALGAGGTNLAAADSVFARLDKDGDGAVSSNELASVLSGSRRGHGHHGHAGGVTSGTATSSYNVAEQAIQRQAQAVASTSVSA